jgi:hypothetical protein
LYSVHFLEKGKKTHREEEKTLAKLASKFKTLLANSKFHSHLASWRVVISTPALGQTSQSLQFSLSILALSLGSLIFDISRKRVKKKH